MNLAELQQAVWSRLDSQVGASFASIHHDAPPAGDAADAGAFPYITISYVVNPNDTKTETGGNVLIQVHLWHRTHDNLARAALHDEVHAALDRHSLAISGTSYADCRFDSSSEIADPDGETRHIVMRFRARYFLA